MKITAFLAAALFASVAALAQTDKAPAKSAAPEAAKREAAKPKAMARKHNPRRSQDARHCLAKDSNTEIIKCAEAYL